MLKECVVVLAILGFVCPTDIMIDKNTDTCGNSHLVQVGEEYLVKSMGELPGTECSYNFTGEVKNNCMGLCYALQPGSFFKDLKASLKVVLGSQTVMIHNKYVTFAPWCSEDIDMIVTLSVASDYVFDPKNKGFDFALGVYDRCGQSGMGKSLTFEEAIKNLENYHHGEIFDDTVAKNRTYGILVGVLLAAVFLVILLITWCYYKHSPNRGRSRSGLMPKSFTKKMDVEKDSKKKKEDPEAHYTYKKTDPERVQHEPEGKPLLSGAAADPEKPPVDTKQ